MNIQRSPFAGLFHIVEYRRKDGGHGWIPMAAFDGIGVAERYVEKCSSGNSENWPWEYRLIELERPDRFGSEPTLKS